MLPALGVDFGGVIVPAAGADTGRLQSRRPLDVQPLEGALVALREVRSAFGGRVWIVSKAGPGTELWTRQWLAAHRFAAVTSIAADHVCFVRDRGAKREVCKSLEITHFIDDRSRNLDNLRGQAPHLYLFGSTTSAAAIHAVANWSEARHVLLESLSGGNDPAPGQPRERSPSTTHPASSTSSRRET